MEPPRTGPDRPLVLHEDDVPPERWDDDRGLLAFRTLFSGDQTPTSALTTGVAELGPGGWLARHRHDPAEVYHVVAGRGVVSLDGVEHPVRAGSAVFVPGGAEHGIRSEGDEPLRFLYLFAVDSFDDVVYRFGG